VICERRVVLAQPAVFPQRPDVVTENLYHRGRRGPQGEDRAAVDHVLLTKFYNRQTRITSALERGKAWVQEAVRGGARLLCGGNRKGSLFEPTVLTSTKPNMKVNCQEIFAPVVTVEPYNDFASALKQINSSAYGLQAGLFTRDAKLIFQAYDELEVGGLIAGDVPTFRIDHMPYGGIKDSGLGREGLRDAIREMTEPKLLVMHLR
jgi:acyl-CoA reductase-like NAD-dependent aldehyde dehydrogenase